MTTTIAFLRGINVGGNKTIRMARLRDLFDGAGLGPAGTLLNSGNVVFQTGESDRRSLATSLEKSIEEAFGFRPAVMLRSAGELSRIIERNPFPAMAHDDPSHLIVMLLAEKPAKGAQERLSAAYQGPEEIHISGEQVYVTYPKGIGTSKLTNILLEKQLGTIGTARNWNTMEKLQAMCGL